ncbi:MAG: acetate--CoA ligase family protein [Candidatus Lokiarchaeota archaeon]|nr:acetate--CoA ligase family protein [Candidatus Lokiarchaeota archaeon]
MEKSDISKFFNPKSIAIIGASSKDGKVGNSVIKNVINSQYTGKVYPINPRDDEILGIKAYKNISDVPEEIDIAIFVIPSKFVVPVVEECGKKGVKGIIIITAGFKEIGGEGVEREDKIIQLAKQYNMRIVGPNCLGFICSSYNGSFAHATPKKGQIAMISQSGAMLTGMLDYSLGQSYGFSCNISLGNKADLGAVDFIEYLAEDDNTKVIICYLESINDGKRFLKVVPKAARRKPIIILKSGISEAGARAASSHTGSLTGSDTAYDLAFEKCGVIRANSIQDLFDFAEVFLYQPIPKKNSFAIITNAGGPGIVATDAFSNEGLILSEFSDHILHTLRNNLPAEAAIFNPVDIVGDAPPERYVFAIKTIFGINDDDSETLEKEEEITTHGALIILTPQAQTDPSRAAKFIQKTISKYLKDKTIVCSFIGDISIREGRQFLKNNQIPCYQFPDRAAHTLKTMIKRSYFVEQQSELPSNLKKYEGKTDRVKRIIKKVRNDKRTVLLSYETVKIFECYGIKAPKTKLARTPRQAMEIQPKIGNAVMKVVSPQIIHKTDVGGIALDISTPEEASKAYIQIVNNCKKYGPQNARIYGVEIQEMINYKEQEKVTELILGMSRDTQFGPIIMIGAGGIYANFLKDVSFALSYQFSEENAKKMLQKTKTYILLQGVRGEKPSDIKAVIDVLLKLSQLVNDFPEIVELDINPLLSFVKGYSAVDIKITISKKKIRPKTLI